MVNLKQFKEKIREVNLSKVQTVCNGLSNHNNEYFPFDCPSWLMSGFLMRINFVIVIALEYFLNRISTLINTFVIAKAKAWSFKTLRMELSLSFLSRKVHIFWDQFLFAFNWKVALLRLKFLSQSLVLRARLLKSFSIDGFFLRGCLR